MKFKCVGCGLYWNVSIYQQIPHGGYICPHCESRLRAGEPLPNQISGRKDQFEIYQSESECENTDTQQLHYFCRCGSCQHDHRILPERHQ